MSGARQTALAAATPNTTEVRLRREFSIAQPGDGTMFVTGPATNLKLQFSRPAAEAAIRSLEGVGVVQDDIEAQLGGGSDAAVLAEWLYAIGLLHEISAVEYTGSRDDIVVVPHSAHWQLRKRSQLTYAGLSRFARMRLDSGRLIIESPLALASVELCSSDAIALLTDASEELAPALSDALHAAVMLADTDGAASSWSFADAALHANSRAGFVRGAQRRRKEHRRTLRFSPDVQEWVTLPRITQQNDTRSLDEVVFARQSRRSYTPSAISIAELGELLGRSSWEKERVLPNGHTSVVRAYPSGGSCHSLDLFVAVARCEGLDPALYLYDRRAHALGLVSGAALASALMLDARAAVGEMDDGQTLIILASDFEAVTSRYDGLPYSLILKEVGSALQTIHLVAASMNLAACVIGSGDSGLFARAVGSGVFEYTSVGEILIGSAV